MSSESIADKLLMLKDDFDSVFQHGKDVGNAEGYMDGYADGRRSYSIANFRVVSNVDQFYRALADSNCYAIFLSPGRYILSTGLNLTNTGKINSLNTKLICGASSDRSDVELDFGANVAPECPYAVDSSNGAIIVYGKDNPVTIMNLTITNSSDSTHYLIADAGGESFLTLKNVNLINNGSKTAMNLSIYKTSSCVTQTANVLLESCGIANRNPGTTLSPNKYAPIQLRNGVNLTLKDCIITTEQTEAPSISVVYGDGDLNIENIINIDNTLRGKHGDVEAVIIYSEVPSDKWIDKVMVNGVQLIHTDNTTKGGGSTIEGWNAYDANDWDSSLFGIPLNNYNGYLYTNNTSLNPNDYY